MKNAFKKEKKFLTKIDDDEDEHTWIKRTKGDEIVLLNFFSRFFVFTILMLKGLIENIGPGVNRTEVKLKIIGKSFPKDEKDG